MRIHLGKGVPAARLADGWVVVIDVLRAFTTAAVAFGRGVERIILAGTVDEARELRRWFPDALLCGEVDGRPIAGFDFGNSPEVIDRSALRGRTLILRSTSGTQGVVHAARAQAVLIASLVVARATARYLVAAAADPVHLLAMGAPGTTDDEEDVACADLITAHLRGDPVDEASIAARVRASPAGQRALNPAVTWISPGDLDQAMAIDRFDFAMLVTRDPAGLLVARPVPAG